MYGGYEYFVCYSDLRRTYLLTAFWTLSMAICTAGSLQLKANDQGINAGDEENNTCIILNKYILKNLTKQHPTWLH